IGGGGRRSANSPPFPALRGAAVSLAARHGDLVLHAPVARSRTAPGAGSRDRVRRARPNVLGALVDLRRRRPTRRSTPAAWEGLGRGLGPLFPPPPPPETLSYVSSPGPGALATFGLTSMSIERGAPPCDAGAGRVRRALVQPI